METKIERVDNVQGDGKTRERERTKSQISIFKCFHRNDFGFRQSRRLEYE